MHKKEIILEMLSLCEQPFYSEIEIVPDKENEDKNQDLQLQAQKLKI